MLEAKASFKVLNQELEIFVFLMFKFSIVALHRRKISPDEWNDTFTDKDTFDTTGSPSHAALNL